MSLQVIFGNMMRKKRKSLGMRQEELALLADIDVRHIHNLEFGHVKPTIRTMIVIACILDVSLDEIKQFAKHDEDGIYRKEFDKPEEKTPEL